MVNIFYLVSANSDHAIRSIPIFLTSCNYSGPKTFSDYITIITNLRICNTLQSYCIIY